MEGSVYRVGGSGSKSCSGCSSGSWAEGSWPQLVPWQGAVNAGPQLVFSMTPAYGMVPPTVRVNLLRYTSLETLLETGQKFVSQMVLNLVDSQNEPVPSLPR